MLGERSVGAVAGHAASSRRSARSSGGGHETIGWTAPTPSERVARVRASAEMARAASARAHDGAAEIEDAAAALYDGTGHVDRAAAHRAAAERHRAAAIADRVPAPLDGAEQRDASRPTTATEGRS